MKKTVILIIVAILLISLPVAYFFIAYWDEIPSRFARYHTTGTITVVKDGVPMDLGDAEISFIGDTGTVCDQTNLDAGTFKFKKGRYGFNYFQFKIPNEMIGEIDVRFGLFNGNWWHVIEYDVNLALTTNEDGTITAEINADVIGRGEKTSVEDVKTLTAEDKAISIQLERLG